MMNDFQKHFSLEWSNFLFGTTYILWVVNCAGLGLINHLWKSHVICNLDEEWWCSVEQGLIWSRFQSKGRFVCASLSASVCYLYVNSVAKLSSWMTLILQYQRIFDFVLRLIGNQPVSNQNTWLALENKLESTRRLESQRIDVSEKAV